MLLSLRIALKALATHKMRTVLAMLGVFLGTFALTGVLHISLAMERKAVLETEKLGPNLLMAMTGNIRFRRGDIRPDAGNTNLKLPDAVALLRGLPAAVDGVDAHGHRRWPRMCTCRWHDASRAAWRGWADSVWLRALPPVKRCVNWVTPASA